MEVDVDEGLELGCKSKGAIFETLAINKVEIGFYRICFVKLWKAIITRGRYVCYKFIIAFTGCVMCSSANIISNDV